MHNEYFLQVRIKYNAAHKNNNAAHKNNNAAHKNNKPRRECASIRG
jgi:hypothetical protein